MYCKNCGRKLAEDEKYCINCGTAAETESSSAYRYVPPKKQRAEESTYRYVPPKQAKQEESTYRYVPPKQTKQEESTYRYVSPKQAKQEESTYRYVPPKQEKPENSTYHYASAKQETKAAGTPGAAAGQPREKKTHTPPRSQQPKAAAPKKRSKAWSYLAWAAVLCGVLVFLATYEPSGSSGGNEGFTVKERPPIEEPTAETFPMDAQRLPSVPADLCDHFLLQSRGRGACKYLKGNVGITVIFVDDSESSWTQQEIDEYRYDIDGAVNRMIVEAWEWGTPLNITIDQDHCAIEGLPTSAMAMSYVGPILKTSGRSVLEDPKNALGVEEAPIVFVFNKHGRAHACINRNNIEYLFLFNDQDAFRHELNHLFGAADFYYHDDIVTSARTWLGESVMLDSETEKVDDLTAYLIGWTDELSPDALGFLRATAQISEESLMEAQEENSFSGVGTKTYDNGAVYSGYMINSMPQGWGTMTWPDGTVYEGNFKEGIMIGYGVMTWPDGSVYSGDFLDSQPHGEGTLTDANGNTLSGTWNNGEFVG